jgi:pseudomonalisin
MLAVLAVGGGLLSLTSPATEARAAAPAWALPSGSTLQPGQFLTSRLGHYRLVMQTNGDLVLFGCATAATNCTTPYWSLGTSGQPGNRLTMQRDGNLVVYSSTGRAVWATRTNGTGNSNVFQLQDDSNMVIYSGQRAVWSTGTASTYAHVSGRAVSDLTSQNGRFTFGTPGNSMHVWDRNVPVWGVNCLNDPRVNCNSLAGQLVLQTDGNLVWYQPGRNGGRVAVWSSGTQGTGRTTYLQLGNDGNLVLFDLWRRAIWSSRTGLIRPVR